jgi:hypothetical protein
MKQEGKPAENGVNSNIDRNKISMNTHRRLVTVQVSFYNGRNAIRKEGKDACLNEQPYGHFVIQRHIREALIFTVPERGSSRWILSRKELWIKYLQQ